MKLPNYSFAALMAASFACPIAYGAVANLAVSKADGTTNLWPDQSLNTVTVFSSTNQPTTEVGAVFNDAYFVSLTSGAGSGQYRTLFRLQAQGNQGSEQGYNRLTSGGEFNETSLGPSSSEFIRISDLVTSNDGLYYIFSFDANEGGAAPKLISLDQLRVYTRPDEDGNTATIEDPSPLPNTVADLGNLGILRYDLDSNADNTIVIEAGGSGQSDMFFYIPVDNFAGASDSDLVYLFADHGNYNPVGSSFDFSASSGFEEWSIPTSVTNRPSVSPTPEPTSTILLIFAFGFGLLRRNRL